MTADLRELFDQAGRNAPAPTLDPNAIVRRARRRRRQSIVGAAAVAGVVALGIGVVAWTPSLWPRPAPVTSPSPHPTASSVTVPVSAPVGGFELDHGTGTMYAVTGGVSVIATSSCNVAVRTGCGAIALIGEPADDVQAIAVNPSDHTLYASQWDNSLAVVDVASCTGSDTSGCPASVLTVPLGVHPGALAVDPASDTLYVADGSDHAGGTVWVIDGATCHAGATSGCRPVATIATAAPPQAMLVDTATHTLFVSSTAPSLQTRLQVVDTTTCNGTTWSGCTARATVALGLGETHGNAMAIETGTHTLYAPNYTDGTLSLVDIGTCNASDVGGCGRSRTVTVGDSPAAVAVDHGTGAVYVADFGDNTVMVIDGNACNAGQTSGCRETHTLPTGEGPDAIAVDPAAHTVYVGNNFEATLNLLPADR